MKEIVLEVEIMDLLEIASLKKELKRIKKKYETKGNHCDFEIITISDDIKNEAVPVTIKINKNLLSAFFLEQIT